MSQLQPSALVSIPASKVHSVESTLDARRRNSALKGTSTLLVGAAGSGKTTSLVSLIEAGLELAVIVTDPGGEESLYDAMEARKLDLSRLHTRYVAPAAASWANLRDMAQKINMMNYEGLSGLKAGIGKEGYKQFLDFLDACSQFKADFTGRDLGPVDTWTAQRALAIDSASGLNMMSMNLMIGAKPTAHQGEYGVAMNAEEQLIYKLVADTSCFLVLTAHPDRVVDEVTGSAKTMPAFLGNKLAPKIPRIFSDVVLSYREAGRFFWSTSAINVDLKNRTLPLGDKLEPSFKPIVEGWKRRNEQMRRQQEVEQLAQAQTQAKPQQSNP